MNPSASDSHANEIKVWDPLVRIGHWILVVGFFIAYLTEDELLDLHVWAGYVVLAYIVVRLVWGVVGSRYARFTDFVYRPSVVIQYLKDALVLKAPRYIGHNPAGGVMVVVLLLSLTATSVSGLATYGAEEQAGPLANFMSGSSDFWREAAEELHELFANLTLLLVAAHIIGVLYDSMAHGENLIRAMFTGRKRKL